MISRVWFRFLVALMLALLPGRALTAQEPQVWRYNPGPFDDGSRYIWFWLNLDGYARPYEITAAMPFSRHYEEVHHPQHLDIIWWPSFAVTYLKSPDGEEALAWPKPMTLSALQDSLGPPRHFRPIDTDGDSLGARWIHFEAFGQKIMCTNPDPVAWLLEVSEIREEPRMGDLRLMHVPIQDPLGRPIWPMLGLLAEPLPEPMPSLEEYAELTKSKFEMVVDEQRQEGEMIICHAHYGDAIVHNLILGFRIEGSIGYYLICDSTEGVYDAVREDMEAFIRSFEVLPPER